VDQALKATHISWNTWRKLLVARGVLFCAQQQLKRLQYFCADGIHATAQTYPLLSNKVHLADSYFGSEDLARRGVLLHEATHHCMASDAAYFDRIVPPHDVGPLGWQTIADTYGFWITEGFCIPGECRYSRDDMYHY